MKRKLALQESDITDQMVIDLGLFLGNPDIIELVTGKPLQYSYTYGSKGWTPGLGESAVVFKSRRPGDSGHFHFVYNTKGKMEDTDSYKEGWQKSGSNGFCQTFAMMLAVGESPPHGANKADCSKFAAGWMASKLSSFPARVRAVLYWFDDDEGGDFSLSMDEIIEILEVITSSERISAAIAQQADLDA